MRIERVEIESSSPGVTAGFYRHLGLEIGRPRSGAGAVVRIGSTELVLVPGAAGVDAFYHLAINVPPGSIGKASAWLADRGVDRIAPPDGAASEIVRFEAWRADAVYFQDPMGNIVELIARERTEAPDPDGFGPEHLLRISEIGIVTGDGRTPAGAPTVAETATLLSSRLGLRPFPDPEAPVATDATFAALGDDAGLLILAQRGRAWFPTADRHADVFPLRIDVDGPVDQGAVMLDRLGVSIVQARGRLIVTSRKPVPCVSCGYDLRTLSVDGACPECGRPVRDTTSGDLLSAADPAWLGRLVLGQRLIALGSQMLMWSIVGLLLIGIALLLAGLLGAVPRAPWTDGVAILAQLVWSVAVLGGLGLCLVGALVTTTPEPREIAMEGASSTHRVRARMYGVATGVVLVAAMVLAWQAEVFRSLSIVALVLGALAVRNGLRYLAGLARRIPDPPLAARVEKRARSVLELLGLFGLFVAGTFMKWLVVEWNLAWPSAAKSALSGIVALVGLGCAIGVLTIAVSVMQSMMAYRLGLREALSAAPAAGAGGSSGGSG